MPNRRLFLSALIAAPMSGAAAPAPLPGPVWLGIDLASAQEQLCGLWGYELEELTAIRHLRWHPELWPGLPVLAALPPDRHAGRGESC